jgi:hypothetical protein
MELLIGAVMSIAMELYKRLLARYGAELTKDAIFILLFVGTTLWTVLVRKNIITQETIQYAVAIFTASIATYEVVIKHLMKWWNNRGTKQTLL